MSITVNCQECGRKLKAPDSAAGKRAKCPSCGATVVIEQPIYDAEEITDEEFGSRRPAAGLEPKEEPASDTYGLQDVNLDEEYEEPALPNRRPCPMCGELIAAEALKCRFCGEDFTEPAEKKAKRKSRDRSPTGGELTGIDWTLCILCSGIGCIVGIVALVNGDSARGGKMIGLSLVFSFMWNVITIIIQSLAQSP